MNKLEQKILDRLYEHEYEEIPNSALYKFNYEEAAKEMTDLTTDVSVKFLSWCGENRVSLTTEDRRNEFQQCWYYGRNISPQQLFEIFIENHYETNR
jgi:hypothetical protein